MKKLYMFLLSILFFTSTAFGSWLPERPTDNEKLKDTPALIRANWDALALGTDASLKITNDKVSATAGIVDTKLAQITTASKVSGSAITGLASIPNGAGALPVANGGTGQTTLQASLNALIGTSEQGDVVYFNGTNWLVLHHGTNGQFLKTGGDSANPSWGSQSTIATDVSIASQARGDLLYFDGSNWVRLAKGTDGQYLKIGANDPAWASVSGGFSSMEVFTSSGTWTKPEGITKVLVECIGGGGGSSTAGGDSTFVGSTTITGGGGTNMGGGTASGGSLNMSGSMGSYPSPPGHPFGIYQNTYGMSSQYGGGGYAKGTIAVTGDVTVTVGNGGSTGGTAGLVIVYY